MRTISFIVAMLLCMIPQAKAQDVDFSYESGNYLHSLLKYRKATFNTNETSGQSILAIYLHGGTSRGSDNEKPLTEAATDSIANYLQQCGMPATFIVPQCPENAQWDEQHIAQVRGLIYDYTANHNIDSTRVYIFGASMGGSGVWNALSTYPGVFAAGMAVAGDPTRYDAESVAQTPIFTVVGTADVVMNMEWTETFTQKLDSLGGEYRFETEDGYDHETTCTKAFTKERLEWVFAHELNNTIEAVKTVSNSSRAIKETQYFSIDGQRLQAPMSHGIYLQTIIYTDATSETHKIIAR